MTSRASADVAALAALAALGLVGTTAAVVAVGGALFVVASRPLGHLRAAWWLVAPVLLGLVVAATQVGPPGWLAFVLAPLLVHRRLAARGIADDRAAVLVSGLLLLTVASISEDPLFLPCWVVFAVTVPGALAPTPLPWRTTLGLSAVVTALAVLLFAIAPRIPEGLPDEVTTGFAPAVTLDAFDHLSDDPTVVFTGSSDPPLEGRVFWRGLALDTFDGRRWTASAPASPAYLRAAESTQLETPHTVTIASTDPSGVVFLPGRPLSLTVVPGALAADGSDGWRVLPPAEVTYEAVVFAVPAPGGPLFPPEADAGDLAAALALPALAPEIAELASTVAGTGPPVDQVERLARWLRGHMTYTRRASAGDTAVSRFLMVDRAGHCELFATGLAVLARSRGIPSRLVTGFVAETGPGGRILVRRQDSHAWVEIHDPALGWVPFDATPVASMEVARGPSLLTRLRAAWHRDVVALSRADQLAAVTRVRDLAVGAVRAVPGPVRGVLALLTVVGAVIAFFGRSRRRRRSPRRGGTPATVLGPVGMLHQQARAIVAAAGWDIPTALPPVAAAAWLGERAPGAASEALLALAWLTYEVELGGLPLEPRLEQARALLAEVRRVLPDRVLRHAS